MTICKTHPKYKAKAKPRSTCEVCWAKWFGLHSTCVDGCCKEVDRVLSEMFPRD